VYLNTKNFYSLGYERVQTGVRIEKRSLKVMKALAEYHDLTRGDLIEESFDGTCPFGAESLKRIAEFKQIYHLDLDFEGEPHAGGAKSAPTLAEKPGRAGDAGIRRKS
jgi:hypothetical protein